MSNILEVTFESGQTFATATRLWKGDYGQILLIHGPELPSYYEVHFASTKDGTPEVSVGTPSGVQIPNRLLQAEGYIYAWVFLHVGANDGATKFQVKIPVEERGIPVDQETPADQTAVQQAIAALNAETGRAEAAADAAEVSEQNAKASEDAASLSEQNAEAAARAAAVSAENAAMSETGAAESEAAAAASAQQAATSAEAAAEYAASAGGSEELVEEYARRAKGSADTAELYGTMAVNAKDVAEASARSATQASQAAVSAKNIADTAAQTATQKASEASSSAGVASSQASMAAAEAAAASGYADNAEGSARQAAASAEDAADSADDADDSAASARLNNEQAQEAKVYAQTAAGNASVSQTAAEAAQTAAETAQGKAEDAQEAAETAQDKAEDAQTAAETAQGMAEAAQTAAEAAQYIAEDAADEAQSYAAAYLKAFPTDTADGPVASFPDGADDIPLKVLTVDINPIQSGSGDPSPENVRPISGWDGVDVFIAGKNLYDRSLIHKSGNYVELNGTHTPSTSDDGKRARGIYLLADQKYTLYVDLGRTQTYGLYAMRSGYSSQITIERAASRKTLTVTYTPTYSGYYCFWLYTSGGTSNVNLDDVVFQVYLGEVEFTQAEPTTKKNISVPFSTGTSLYDRTRDGLEQGSINSSYVDADNDYRLRTGYIAVSPSTSYTIDSNLFFIVYEYSSQSSSGGVSQGSWNAPYRTITTGASTAYIRVALCKDLLGTNEKVTPSDFEFLTIQTPPSEVYGGTLDVLTGTLTTRPYYASYNGETLVGPWVSSMDTYEAGATPTTGAQVVDLGGTPTVVQLDPETVSTLLGVNNIWADTDDTHAIYRADIGLYIQKLTGSTEEDMTANVNIASGKYFLVGNTLYLSTSAIAAGEQIIPGTNCTLTNLAAALNALNS